MSFILCFLLDVLCSIAEIQFVLWYYFRIYGLPQNAARLRAFSSLFMLAVSCILRIIFVPQMSVSFPILTILCSFVFLPLLPGRWEKKLLFSFILISVSAAWTFFFDFLFTPLPNKNVFLAVIFFHAGFWLLLAFLRNLGSTAHQEIPKSMWLLLHLTALLSAAVILTLLINFARSGQNFHLTIEIPVLFALLLINLTLFVFFDRFSELLEKTRAQSRLEQQISLQETHYMQLQAYQNQISALHHDMKNHIGAAVNLIKSDSSGAVLSDYLQSVYGELEQAEETVATGNPGIDAVLNLKLSQLKHAGVRCETDIHIPAALPLPFADSVIILGNLLDNAREACEKLPDSARWVHISMSYVSHALYIKVDNAVCISQETSIGQDLPQTTKDNPALHGYGLQNIKQITEKCGSLQIDRSKPDVFSVRIMLYDL